MIRDFLGVEDQMGTWEATRTFGEELEMHKIELNHNVLGCQEHLVEGVPTYCPRSRYHPDHPFVTISPLFTHIPNTKFTITLP